MTDTPAGAPYRPAYIRAANGLYYRIGVSTTQDAPYEHGSLSGLDQDQHPQYLLPTEVIAGTNITVDRATTPGSVRISSSAVSGVTAHGLLSGLSNDDHTQYYNAARGDARYLKRNLPTEETSGSFYASDFGLSGTSGNTSEITWHSSSKKRWSLYRNNDDEGQNATLIGSSLRLASYRDDGSFARLVFDIQRYTGEARYYGDINDPNSLVTRQYVDDKIDVVTGNFVNQGTFVEFANDTNNYPYNRLTNDGHMIHMQGMYKTTANFTATAGAEYAICKIAPAFVEYGPQQNFLWAGGVFSLNGATASSTLCRIRIDPAGVVRFSPPVSGTFTTNGWITFSGSMHTF